MKTGPAILTAIFVCATPAVAQPDLSQALLFQAGFDHDAPGIYTPAAMKADFHAPLWSDGVDEGLAQIVARCNTSDDMALRINYPAGQVSAGVIIPVTFSQSYDELYLSYEVYFPAGFNFVREGKLSGLCGGTCNSGGEKPTGQDGWSSRIIWRSQGQGAQYLYRPDQAGQYGDIDLWSSAFTTGVWHHVETHVKMNHPGRADGLSESWLDGNQVYRNAQIRWRDTDRYAIDSFRFETFFGGGSAEFAPPTAQYALFDNIVVSTQRSRPRHKFPPFVSEC